MNKHTPGPWAFDGHSRVDALPLRKPSPHKLKDEDGTEREYMEGLVAPPYGCGPDTHEANALLIAAAPELLEALRTMLDAFHEDPMDADVHGAVDKAYEAIAKATGEQL